MRVRGIADGNNPCGARVLMKDRSSSVVVVRDKHRDVRFAEMNE